MKYLTKTRREHFDVCFIVKDNSWDKINFKGLSGNITPFSLKRNSRKVPHMCHSQGKVIEKISVYYTGTSEYTNFLLNKTPGIFYVIARGKRLRNFQFILQEF